MSKLVITMTFPERPVDADMGDVTFKIETVMEVDDPRGDETNDDPNIPAMMLIDNSFRTLAASGELIARATELAPDAIAALQEAGVIFQGAVDNIEDAEFEVINAGA